VTEPREIRVFVASPDDVGPERRRVERIIARLNTSFGEAARFRAVRWETHYYTAHKTWQAQIPEAKDCDVVLVIFGNKLGSDLPLVFPERLPDGTPFPSGTAYELISSLESAKARERPDVFVFRTTSEPSFGLSEENAFLAAKAEYRRLNGFFEQWVSTSSDGFTRPSHKFTSTDDFERQVDDLLRQWAEKTLTPTHPCDIKPDESPFRGLRAFDARHSKVYFGRDRKVARALDELLRARESRLPFLLIVGPSGAGKSSMVRAGLIPRLVAPGVVQEVDLWRTAVMRPGAGDNAFAALAQALLVRADSPEDEGGFGAALPELTDGPYKTAELLADTLATAAASVAAPILSALDGVSETERRRGDFTRPLRTDLLLLVDQLEEIFVDSVPAEQRTAFGRLLTRLAESGRVWIVATLRADLYSQMLDPNAPFLALKDNGGSYDLASPGEAELREILDRSAAAAGLVYERDPDTGDSLDEVLLREASGKDALPLLQFTLEQLYEDRALADAADGQPARLTFAAYDALGGMGGAIGKVAESALSDPKNGLGRHEIEHSLPRLIRRFAEPVRGRQDATTGLTAMTARPVPLAEATADASARRLVHALVRARLLVSASDEEAVPSVRLAHERVLNSWDRALKIVREHRDFFRIRADIVMENERWLAGHRRRELLMSGVPLLEAERVVRTYDDELSELLRDYVALSSHHARRRQRVRATIAAGMFGVGMVATVFGVLAVGAEQKATREYAAAKEAADTLVSSVPRALANQTGIATSTVNGVLAVVGQLIDGMEAAAKQQQNSFMGHLGAGFDRIEGLLPGATRPGDELRELERSRSNMLYEFAEVYHKSADNIGVALVKAQSGLGLRRLLVQGGDDSPEAHAAVALAEMQLGDLRRLELDPPVKDRSACPAPRNLAPVRDLYAPAEATLAGIAKQFPDETRWARWHAQIATRMGDLDLAEGHPDNAASWYLRAGASGLRVFRAAPTDTGAVKEFAMTFRKTADVLPCKGSWSGAAEVYAKDVCVRRRLVAMGPGEISWPEDLGWSLFKLAGARAMARPAELELARDAAYEALVVRLELTKKASSKPVLFAWVAQSLGQVGGFHAASSPELAGAFDAAAADVRRGLETFPDESKPPLDPAVRGAWERRLRDLREQGAMALIDEPRRWTIQAHVDAFVRDRPPAIAEEGAGCWERLLGTVTAEVSSPYQTR
jgi:eukaryotic-like serine/threonine-protein kinase